MKKCVCLICGCVYDEDEGDLGSKWEELPEDWTCLICGADKGQFQVIDE